MPLHRIARKARPSVAFMLEGVACETRPAIHEDCDTGAHRGAVVEPIPACAVRDLARWVRASIARQYLA
jgi:hypothetical protein